MDGVLNSNFRNQEHQIELSDGILLDEENIKLLCVLVRKTDAKIILHSGWRFWFDHELQPLRAEAEKLVEMLKKEGMSIEGVIPDLTTPEIRKTKKFSLVKAGEILAWLKGKPEVAGWVVLEDLDLHNETVEHHQVKTDATIGLTLKDVEKAEKILRNEF